MVAKLFADESILEAKRAEGKVHAQDLDMRAMTPDVAYQAREEHLNMDHVAYLERVLIDGMSLSPCIVFRFADGTLKLVDGFHRWNAYRRFGAAAIPTLIVDGTHQEAVEFAAAANQRASLGRKKGDIKRAAFMLFENGWFGRAIQWTANHVGVTSNTIQKWLAEFAAIKGIVLPSVVERTDGTFTPRNKASTRAPGKNKGRVNGRVVRSLSAFQSAEADFEASANRLRSSARLSKALARHGVAFKCGAGVAKHADLGCSSGCAVACTPAPLLHMTRELIPAIMRAYFARDYFAVSRAVVLVVTKPEPGELTAFAERFRVEILTFDEFVASVAPAAAALA